MPLQPHPASDQAAASVVASGAQTTIQLPRVHFPDDDSAYNAPQTYADDWHDEPLSPVTTVYGEPPTLARQQTFGRVDIFFLAVIFQQCSWAAASYSAWWPR